MFVVSFNGSSSSFSSRTGANCWATARPSPPCSIVSSITVMYSNAVPGVGVKLVGEILLRVAGTMVKGTVLLFTPFWVTKALPEQRWVMQRAQAMNRTNDHDHHLREEILSVKGHSQCGLSIRANDDSVSTQYKPGDLKYVRWLHGPPKLFVAIVLAALSVASRRQITWSHQDAKAEFFSLKQTSHFVSTRVAQRTNAELKESPRNVNRSDDAGPNHSVGWF